MSEFKLTEKQEAFCQAYAVYLSAPKAASEAGYADVQTEGYRLLRKEHVVERIKELCAERSQRFGIDRDWVIAEALENYQRCMQQVKPQLNSKTGKPILGEDEDGNQAAIFTYNSNMAHKFLDLISKLTNSYPSDKLEVQVSEDDVVKRMLRGRGSGSTEAD